MMQMPGGARPLGGNERGFWRFDQVQRYNFTFVGRVSGRLAPSHVRRALDAVQARHPLLRMRVTASRKGAFESAGVPAIPLRVVPREGADHWVKEVEAELDAPLPWREGPLMRAVLLAGDAQHEILLTFHHMLGDGYSGAYLMRDVLAYAAGFVDGVPIELAPLPLRPSIEGLLPAAVQGARGALRIMKRVSQILRAVIGMKVRRIPSRTTAEPASRQTRVIQAVLPPDVTARLVARCRAEKTSVHGLLCAAALKAAAGCIQEQAGISTRVGVGCLSPVNLRSALLPSVAMDELGLYVAFPTLYEKVGADSPLWPLARALRQRLVEMKEHGDLFGDVRFRDLAAPSKDLDRAQVRRLAESPMTGTVSVTNLTQLDIPTRYGSLALERLHFAMSTHGTGNFPTFAVLTLAGWLYLDFTYCEPLLDATAARALLGAVQAALLREAELAR